MNQMVFHPSNKTKASPAHAIMPRYKFAKAEIRERRRHRRFRRVALLVSALLLLATALRMVGHARKAQSSVAVPPAKPLASAGAETPTPRTGANDRLLLH